MKKFLKYLLYFLAFLLILSIALIVPVDRTPYKELGFYQEIDTRLDSLQSTFIGSTTDSLRVGMAKISITPSDTVPLAGYSGREPKKFAEIMDSVFVRTLVLSNGKNRAALISAELLIIHPEVANVVRRAATELGWNPDEILFSATHTHSSIGGWSPGFAGELVVGEFDDELQSFVVDAMLESLKKASVNLQQAGVSYANSELGMHVRNRLIKDGEEDGWVRNLFFNTPDQLVSVTAYAAHATCFNAHSRSLTGDFPSHFFRRLDRDSLGYFPIYLAGAVGSMGPDGPGSELERAQNIGEELADQVFDLTMFEPPVSQLVSLDAFKVKVPLRVPQLKISRNLKIRPWVFRQLVGKLNVELSVLKINGNLIIGTPCDFSGELAIPLYEYARKKGLNLIITSFNGGYIGYVTKDEWYDMEKYETRTMNWFGPDSGTYFSEIIRRIIDSVAE